jgi:hypothetical protein
MVGPDRLVSTFIRESVSNAPPKLVVQSHYYGEQDSESPIRRQSILRFMRLEKGT